MCNYLSVCADCSVIKSSRTVNRCSVNDLSRSIRCIIIPIVLDVNEVLDSMLGLFVARIGVMG